MMVNLIFLLVIFAVSYASDRPGTPVPSSHRIGVVRVFVPTPPGSPKSPKTPPVVPNIPRPKWERDCLEDGSGRRRRSSAVREDDYKRFDMDNSTASTYMSSDDELETARDSDSESDKSTNLDKCVPDPGLIYRILRALKIRG